MEKQSCIMCQKTKSLLECGLCHESVCKYCAEIMPEGSFSFLANIPNELSHSVYCGPCFNDKIATALSSYNKTLEQAKEIRIFDTNQGKQTRFIRRIEKPFQIENCMDRNETILRLAFLAAKAGFNALVDVQVSSKKIRNEAYQTLSWSGYGVPVNLTPGQLRKEDNQKGN